MTNVVFVTPNSLGYIHTEPVGTLLLATILNQNGIRSRVLPFYCFGDIQDFESFIDRAAEKIIAQTPAIVSFYTRCDTYHISIRIAQRIKQQKKDIYIVFAGPQADISAKETLRVIPAVDYICSGEGENTVVPFFSSLIARQPDHSIDGLTFREGTRIIQNSRPALIEDLDTLPTLDYSLLDPEDYASDDHFVNYFPVDVGRGCPFSCTFCSTNSFWGRKYRLKSADRIVAEIKSIHDTFGFNLFNFQHDMFTMDRKRVIQVCRQLMNIGFPISWRCSARLDCLDNELIDIMTAAGMNSLFIGIETGSPQMQKKIRKNLKLDDAFGKLSYISSKGVSVTASFIFGFPEETEEDFSQTLSMMIELSKIPKIHLQHHLCTFFSGTELTRKYAEQISKSTVFSDITGEAGVYECQDLITENPVLFPHYFEYKNDLREKIKYFPQFFESWLLLRPVFEYIALTHYQNRYCDMLYDFSSSNQELLRSGAVPIDLMRNDRFLECFSNDTHFAILKEISAFLLWKAEAPIGRAVFGFDVKAFLSGAAIENIKPTFSIAAITQDASGKRKMTLQTQS